MNMKIKINRIRGIDISPLRKDLLYAGRTLIFVLVGWLAVLPALPAEALGSDNNDYFDLHNLDERREGYFNLRDEKNGEFILSTARLLHIGDQFIDSENSCFTVTRIDGDTAWAKLDPSPTEGSLESPSVAGEPAAPPQKDREAIGIYHSHGAESYVPSDGTESNDSGGGIIEVGRSFREALQNKGITVEHVQETHVPHDAGAYNRSRRTAMSLLADNLDAVFDVHRDAVPEEEYDRDIDGQDLVQIMMVIGRQNQNMSNNKSFAEGLKKVADTRHPGLIKGILLAQGNYNQDLSSRSILIEVGAHTNARQQAEQSVALFADVVNTYLYAQQGRTEGGGTAAQSALKLLMALVLAIFVYLLISAGSRQEIQKKVLSFFSREFADLRQGWKAKVKEKDDDSDS